MSLKNATPPRFIYYFSLSHDEEQKLKSQPLYEGHIPITPLQRVILAVGSTVVGLTSPARGGNTKLLLE